jgi:sigma-E factor negative regulatory protein RseC
MLEEHAIILAIESSSNANQSIATLEIARKNACGLCGQTRGCGNSMWGKLFRHKPTSFKAQNRINAKVGDSVIVGIDEQVVMKSALLLYMLPLVIMFIVATLVNMAAHNNSVVLLGAIAGLFLGFLWVKGFTAGNSYFSRNQPSILRLDNGVLNTQAIDLKI